MKQSKEMPAKGQFVAVWEASGELWSQAYRWDGDRMLRYESYTDRFIECHYPMPYDPDTTYFTKD